MAHSPAFNRRTFLTRVAQATTLSSLALVTSSTSAMARDAASKTLSASTWGQLAHSLRGRLDLPSSPGFATRALLYNARFNDLRPAAIAYCHDALDVARCLAFAEHHGVTFTTRAGGHSYAGYSSCPGLVIDVSPLNAISVNAKTRTARVGAGVRLIDVYDALGHRGFALPGATCPSVGVAGSTMGGGVGVLARRFGLTCDQLISARVVLASGEHVSVNATHHEDLWWALRGGGGGNFGVATQFEFRLHDLPEVTLFSLRYPWAAAAPVLEGWQQWLSAQPDELWSNCQLFSQGGAGYLAQINGAFCGSPRQLAPALTQLRRHVGAATSTFVGANDYLEAMMIEAGCAKLSVIACHLAGEAKGGLLGHEAYVAKSSYVSTPDSSARATQWVDAVERLHDAAPYLGGGLSFDAYGGAINRVANDATAFVHRDKLASVQATYSWGGSSNVTDVAAGQHWLTWLGTSVFDARQGAYQNYVDPTLVNWPRAYYGKNLERLVKVKNRYDPSNLFSFAQSIPQHLTN